MRIFIITLLLFSQSTFAQSIDTLHVGKSFGDFDKLSYESYPFTVYSEKNGKRGPEISFISATSEEMMNGKRVIAITHTWSGNNFNGSFLALVKHGTFEPIIQIRNTEGKKEAYSFFPDKITGLDSASNNAAADYRKELPHPVFNFEIDIETYAILSMKEGAVFAIPFFHAGSAYSPPAYYKMIVERKEELEINGLGKKMCWVLFIDYAGKQPTRFWYTIDERKFVKMEGEYNGLQIHKIRKF
ncbi:MAG: hypothetical protein ABJG47_15585 [Ekhidna sp.]